MPGVPRVRAYELRSKNKTDLTKQLEELKKELMDLRVQKVVGGSAGKLSRISVVRKSIARVMTVMHQKARTALRELYKGKKHKPLDLRPKQTRAIRRRMTESESRAKTLRQHKRDKHFPARRSFAVKA
ncbi:60S ribosomal protein L35 [Tulasnella sp. 330]|nr:60S ribosomal protein L35 [Tulasnella sp. 330]KAG8874412.1 60S ribosomal protein L35 [Tulasnella sp. 331]KAG8880273.1 60S ribosomal protein L35 [Tulasnella sp. 332]